MLGLLLSAAALSKVCEPKLNTTCADGRATCAKSAYAAAGWACCPFANAVDCATPLGTCCPAGTTCKKSGTGWQINVECVPVPSSVAAAAPVAGTPACKAGPLAPFKAGGKSVLVIGDSVSIGFNPSLTAALAAEAHVQHSPSGGDGGAEETAYGLECLEYFLATPDGTAVHPDVLMFNFGLHDGPCNGANTTIPGGAGRSDVYAPQLRQIAAKLKAYTAATGAKLLFELTTPWLCVAATDALVVKLNGDASKIMADLQIPTVDSHAAIIGKCGKAPVASCFGDSNKGCFCPHCPGNGGAGYSWLVNTTLAPAIRKLL